MGTLTVDRDTVFAYQKGGGGGIVMMHLDDYGIALRRQLFPTRQTKWEKVPGTVYQRGVYGDVDIVDQIQAGQVFEYCTKDYEDAPYGPSETFIVMCFKEPPEPMIDFDQHRPFTATPGGTFCTLSGRAKKVSSYIRVWYDTKPNIWLADRLGPAHVRPHHMEGIGFIETDIITIPGTQHWYVIQLMDELGNYNLEAVQTFTTKQRKVSVRVPQLWVDNDGDPSAHGEAEFRVSIQKLDQAALKYVVVGQPWQIGDDFAQQDITNGEYFQVGLSATVGPEPGDLKVGVNAHGREFDGFLEDDELASTGTVFSLWDPWFIPYRTGKDEVNDVNQKLWVRVPCLTAVEGFSFNIEVNYDVTYV